MEMTASGSPVSVSLHNSKGPEDGGEVPKNHTNLADNDLSVNEFAPGAVSLWHALPVEVFAVIFDHLVAVVHNDMSITRKKRQRAIKCRISHISLVCWHWCRSFRHFLFQQPCLESPEHIQILTNILKNPMSSWLRERITSVFFRNRRKGDAMQMPWPQWRTLLQFLPNLSYLRVAGHFGYMRIYAWRDRPVLNGLHSLRSLQLISMRFPSSSGLIRVLGALPHLEGLSLGAVRWPATEGSPTQLVSCGSGFERIRRAASFGTSEHWPLAWLFAAASTRHRYSMRVDASAIVPPDVLAIVQLSWLCCSKSDGHTTSHVYQRHRMGEDIYIFSLSVGLTVTRRLLFVTGPSPGTGDAQSLFQAWSVRRIVLAGHCPSDSHGLSELDWKTVAAIIPNFPWLESFDVFLCAEDEEETGTLGDDLHSQLPDRPLRIRRFQRSDDLARIIPELFAIDDQ